MLSPIASAMGVLAFSCGFGWRRRERRQTGYGKQKLVRSIEEIQVSVDRTVGCGQKDGSAARVVDSDIRFEAGSATGLFDDVRGGVDWQDVNPAQADASRFAGVVKSLLADQIRRKNIDGLRGGILCRVPGRLVRSRYLSQIAISAAVK
jgi:hypothetical protein